MNLHISSWARTSLLSKEGPLTISIISTRSNVLVIVIVTGILDSGLGSDINSARFLKVKGVSDGAIKKLHLAEVQR
jgi:hypothetical protein